MKDLRWLGTPLLLTALLAAVLGSACTALLGPVPCEADEHCPDGLACADTLCVERSPGDAGAAQEDGGVTPDAGGADSGPEPADGGVDGGSDGGPAIDAGFDGGPDPVDGGGDAGFDAGVNEPPTAVEDTLTLAEDTSDTVDVLLNDSDPEGGALTLLSVGSPSDGVASFTAAGIITYTPDADYFGVDALTYEVTDEQGATATGTLDITITPVDDVPVAPPATWFVSIDTVLSMSLPGEDADGDALTWEALAPIPTLGTLDVDGATGEATYTAASVGGVDRFGYRVNDGMSPSAPGVVDVIVLDKTWVGAVSNDWETADNWSPQGVPGSADAVWIKSGAVTDPVLGQASAIRGLLMDEGVFLELNGFDLTLSGSFRTPPPTAPGGITGTGAIVFGTTVTAARGTAPRLEVPGDATLDGELVVLDSLSIPKDGTLRLADQRLEVRGTTDVVYDSNNTGLILTDPAARADLLGDVTFDGENDAATQTESLTAGEIWLYAHLTSVDTANNPKTLSPLGTVFIFAGTSLQTVTLERPLLTHSRLHDVHIAAGAVVQLATPLVVDGQLTMAPDAQLLGDRIEYAGVLPNTEPGYAVTTSAVVADVTMDADAVVHGLLVTESAMRIDVGPYLLRAHEGLELRIDASGDGLFMEDPAGEVIVDGEAWFDGRSSGASNNNRLTAGTLRFHGDLRQTHVSSGMAVFVGNGTDVILDGTALQTVTFSSPSMTGSRFTDVSLENSAGIRFETAAWVDGDVTVAAGVPVDIAQSLDVEGGFFMLGPATVDGTGVVRMKTDVPNTDVGYAIPTELDGQATLAADRIFHGPLLDVLETGSLDIGGNRLELMNDYRQTTDGTSDGLNMADAADEVIVHGAVEMRCEITSGSTANRFEAGTLRVAGDFTQVHTSSETRSFAADGTLVVLDGVATQVVSFTAPGATLSHFASLTIENPTAVSFTTAAFVTGDLVVTDGASLILADRLHVEGASTWSGAGGVDGAGELWFYTTVPATPAGTAVPVRIVGNTTMSADVVVTASSFGPMPDGQLHLNGHKLEVVGDFLMEIDSSADGVYLNDPADELLVRGDAVFDEISNSGNTNGHLTAGRIVLEGSFAQVSDTISDVVFFSTGTAVLFQGAGVQTVSFDDPTASALTTSRSLRARPSTPTPP